MRRASSGARTCVQGFRARPKARWAQGRVPPDRFRGAAPGDSYGARSTSVHRAAFRLSRCDGLIHRACAMRVSIAWCADADHTAEETRRADSAVRDPRVTRNASPGCDYQARRHCAFLSDSINGERLLAEGRSWNRETVLETAMSFARKRGQSPSLVLEIEYAVSTCASASIICAHCWIRRHGNSSRSRSTRSPPYLHGRLIFSLSATQSARFGFEGGRRYGIRHEACGTRTRRASFGRSANAFRPQRSSSSSAAAEQGVDSFGPSVLPCGRTSQQILASRACVVWDSARGFSVNEKWRCRAAQLVAAFVGIRRTCS